ncbi:MAG TPA: hypothetical protein V6C65_29215, partial [Allocoleopsis sp.]
AVRQTQFQAEIDANHEFIGSEIGQLTRNIASLQQQINTLVQEGQQDRSQAAIDRAEFRSTVEQLLRVLTQQFNANGHSE